MPAENLISPEAVRKLVWPNPPAGIDLAQYIQEALLESSARPWQVEALTELLIEPLRAIEPLVIPEAPVPEESPAESPAEME